MKAGKHLLIVDDNEKNIFALKAVLKSRGFNCLEATGGAVALKILQDNPGIDLVLLDMMMPDMDGYELVKIIKNNQLLNQLPVIAVTAQAMTGDKERCLSAGVDAYLTKPVNIDNLMEVIGSLI